MDYLNSILFCFILFCLYNKVIVTQCTTLCEDVHPKQDGKTYWCSELEFRVCTLGTPILRKENPAMVTEIIRN